MDGGCFRFGAVSVDTARGELAVDGQTVPLQPLPWKLLVLLVQHPGRLFTRAELHDVLWPGVTVTDDSLSQVIRRLRSVLDDPTVLKTVHRRGYKLEADVRFEAGARDDVPPALDRFFGRAGELAGVLKRLRDGERLVTLAGPAGVGKTRLALEIARAWEGRVVLVDLQSARSEEEVVLATARALGAPPGHHDPVRAVAGALQALGAALVVVDNLEQVVASAPRTLGRWLEAAPQAQWLVTSRILSGLRAERVVDLVPLPLEDATALLADRAGGAAPPEGLTPLAEALHGLPLAIELVAPRLRLLTAAQVVDRLGEIRFSLLRRVGPSEHPERHQSLQAALEASWEPLTGAERRALTQLAVWVGSFSVAQAEAVLDVPGLALDVLQSLRDQSLLTPAGPERFAILPTVREFVQERGDAEVRAAAEVRHGRHLTRLEPCEPLVDDLVAACRRAVARGDGEVAAATAVAASEVLRARGPAHLAVALLKDVSAVVADPAGLQSSLAKALLACERPEEALVAQEAALAHALASADPRRIGSEQLQLAFVLARLRDVDGAEQRAAAALALARQVGHRYHEGLALLALARYAVHRGDDATALERYGEALVLAREQGDLRLRRTLAGNLGVTLQRAGRHDEALAHYREALEICQLLGDLATEGSNRANIGVLLAERGQLKPAVDETRRAIAIARQVGQPLLESLHLENLGRMLAQLGRHDEALQTLDEAVRIGRERGQEATEGSALTALAEVHVAAGRPLEAHRLADRALTLLDGTGDARLVATVRLVRAEAALDLGSDDQAEQDMEAAAGLLRDASEVVAMGVVWCLRARLRRRRRDIAGAARALDQADALAAEARLGRESELRRRIAAERAADR